MGRVIFKDVDAVMKQVEHALKAEKHQKSWGKEVGPAVMLVHDDGVYLMSNGIPRMLVEEGSERSVVVHAEGCDPKKDSLWYERSHDLVGGDDFAEELSAADIKRMYSEAKKSKRTTIQNFYVNFSAKSYSFGFSTTLKKKKLKKGSTYRFEGYRIGGSEEDVEGTVLSLRPLRVELVNGQTVKMPDKAKAYAVEA